MSDKNLTELEWKKFSKGRNLKDGAFVKALAALELAKNPDAQLAALDEIEKQADILRKANKGDKEITSYLDDTDKAATKERKLAEFEAKKAAQSQSEGEDEEAPDLLTTKMVPLLRAVPKGEVMHAMIAMAGKDTMVMVSRKAIGAPRRKVMTTALGATGGVKFIAGECIWEANAHTFVLQHEAAGLAKKVRAALLEQTSQRFKVRVRGEDPNDIDDDGEPAEHEASETEGQQATTTGSTESGIPPAPPLPGQGTPGTAPTTAPDADTLAFNTRLAALMPRVKEAITAAGPNANDVRLKVSEAGVFARKKEFDAANALLDDAEKLLGGGNIPPAPPLTPGAPAPTTAVDPDATAFNTRLAALMPRVKEALVAAGPSANDIKLKVSEAGVFARKKEFDQANALLDDAEKLMGSGGGIPPAPPLQTAPGPTTAPAPADADTVAFNARLAALLPQVKEAIAAGGEHAADLKLKVSEAGVFARKKEFASANALLDEVDQLLHRTGLESSAQEGEETEPVEGGEETVASDASEGEESEDVEGSEEGAAQWQKRLAAVEQRYLDTLRGNPEDATKLRALFGMAGEQAEAGQYEKALASLDRLEALLGNATASKDTGYAGIVAYRKTLLDLRAAVAKVEGQIASLVSAIPSQMPDEADLAEALAEDLRESNEELQALVDEAMGTAENEDTPITRELSQKLDSLIDEVGSNEVIKHVDANPFGVALNIGATLSKALSDVRAALPVPA